MDYEKGMFLLDIEIELAWGFLHKISNEKAKQSIKASSLNARKCLDKILFLLDKYRIPVTWGVLGHLVLDRCDGPVPHPEMPRPSYKWIKSDWYAHDPCKTLIDEPAFYGKDIVDKVYTWALQTKVSHDIACHSFSHQLFGDLGCNKEVAGAEVRRCMVIMKNNYGIRLRVFIFPKDFPGHLDILRQNGFVAFRGPIPRVLAYSESPCGMKNRMLKYASLASYWMSFYLGVPPPVVKNVVDKKYGLTNIPGSMCYNKKPFIPLKLIVLKALKGIKRAVKEKKIFHLYTHLINFGETAHTEAFLEGFNEILHFADTLRKRNQLEITMMKRIVE